MKYHTQMTQQNKRSDPVRQAVSGPAPRLSPGSLLNQIYSLIEQHIADPFTVDWLADQLAMNRKTLYRQVWQQTNLSPTELIRQYRMQKATRLLMAGYLIAETAHMVGFNSPSHFTTVFKKQYGQTPSEFINSRSKAT